MNQADQIKQLEKRVDFLVETLLMVKNKAAFCQDTETAEPFYKIGMDLFEQISKVCDDAGLEGE